MTSMAHGVFSLTLDFWKDSQVQMTDVESQILGKQLPNRNQNPRLNINHNHNHHSTQLQNSNGNTSGMMNEPWPWPWPYLVLVNEIGLFTFLLCLVAGAAMHRQRHKLSILLSLVKMKMKDWNMYQQKQNHNSMKFGGGESLHHLWGGSKGLRDSMSLGGPRKILYIPIRRQTDSDEEDEADVVVPGVGSLSLSTSTTTTVAASTNLHSSNEQNSLLTAFTGITYTPQTYDKQENVDDEDDDEKYFSSSDHEGDKDAPIENPPRLALLRNSLPQQRKSILKRRVNQQLNALVDQLPLSQPQHSLTLDSNLNSNSSAILTSKYNLRDRQPVDYYPTPVSNSTSTSVANSASTLKKLIHNFSTYNATKNPGSNINNPKKKVKFGRTFTIVYKRDS